MKLINNRYSINNPIKNHLNNEEYLVRDLIDEEKAKRLRILQSERDPKTIKWFVKNFIWISQIKHRNLLESESFGVIETINLKKINNPIYYLITAYTELPTMAEAIIKPDLEHRVKLLLEIMDTVDYIHFRGFIIKYLSPDNIRCSENRVVLPSLSRIIEMATRSYYDSEYGSFIAPEVLMNKSDINFKADYYSIGVLMKYLLQDCSIKDEKDKNIFDNNPANSQKQLVADIIDNLTRTNPQERTMSLREMINKINNEFGLHITFDLKSERDKLYHKTSLVGFKIELETLLKEDYEILDNTNIYKGCLIRGGKGTGKKRLVDEFTFRMKMRGREVITFDSTDNDILDVSIISRFIQAVEGYKNRFLEGNNSKFSNSFDDFLDKDIGLIHNEDKYKLFIKVFDIINEISKESTIYLVIKNLERSNDIFVELLDYLLNGFSRNSVYLIISLNDNGNRYCDYANKWKNDNLVRNISLNSLTLEDTGNLVKETLGINYVPVKLSKELFINSKGNPSLIQHFLRDLYDRRELYMDEGGYWELRNPDLSKLKLPSSYTEIIDNQLMKYDSKSIEIIEILSVFQIGVSKQTIIKVLNTKLRIITPIIDELLLDGIIEADLNDNDIIYYKIRSDEMKLRVYSSIPLEKRETMHLAVANILMALHPSRMHRVIDEVVYHLSKANKPDVAIKCIIQEAEKIDKKTSPITVMLWEKAYNLAKNIKCEDILKILDSLTFIYSERGETKKTEYYNNILQDRANDMDNLEYKIKAINYEADILLKKNQIEETLDLIQGLKQLSIDRDSNKAMIEALIMEGKILSYMNEESKMIHVLQEAENLVHEYEMKSYLGPVYNLYGIGYNLLGEYEKSIDSYQKSIEFFMKSPNSSDVVKPINNLGFLYGSIDNVDKSLEYYERALAISKKHGSMSLSCIFLNNLGDTYYNKLDYTKAQTYLLEAKKLAHEINNIKVYFLSIINLGLIDLDTNNFESAYEKFLYLEKLNHSNPIIEGEIKYKYNSFLGSFYTSLGYFEIAKKHIQEASDYYKENGIREWLKAQCNLAVLRILKDKVIDKEEINSILNSYSDTDFIYDYLKFLLTMTKYVLIQGDLDFAKILYGRYYELRYKVNSEFLDYCSQIIELLIREDVSSLLEVEKLLYRTDSLAGLYKDVDIRLYLANRYYEKECFSNALRSYFKELDCLYGMTRFVDSKEDKNSIMETKDAELIQKRIINILETSFKKDLSTYAFSKEDKADDILLETALLINGLSSQEYYDVFFKDFTNIDINHLNSLLINLGDNYNDNLDMILRFLCIETLAQRGMIILTDDVTGGLQVASTFLADDLSIPNDAILLNSLRNREPLLYNRSRKDLNPSHLQEIIPKKVNAFICLPITANKRNVLGDLNRRRWDSIQDNQLLGYLYLETPNLLNRFDRQRADLTMSLASVLHLNIQNNRMMKISTNDKVTGTYTRKYLEDRLDVLLDVYKRTESSFSLLMVDIDRFKQINDTYGHVKGDKVLGIIGKIIMESVRESDIVGRYGGEEFLVILNNTTSENAIIKADKIRNNIESTIFPGIDRKITVSIGLSHYPIHSAFKDELIIKADQSLYYAKEVMGRNKCVEWFPGIDSILSKSNKLNGIITGDSIKDNNNLSALVDICELIKENKSYEDKVEIFLETVLEAVGGEYASLITNKSNILCKKRDMDKWATSYSFNFNLIESTIQFKEGRYFIDWKSPDQDNNKNDILRWLSVLVVPLIKEGSIKAILYITVPAKEKEFEAKDLNLCSVLSNIFAGII